MDAQPTSKARAAAALELLMRFTGWRDEDVAERVGKSRSSIQDKRTGGSFTLTDIDTFARAFDVPQTVFLMDAHEVMRWVVDHRPDWVDEFATSAMPGAVKEKGRRPRRSRCTAGDAQPPLPFQVERYALAS